jgi:non-heme chloroperoxidase
VGRVAEAVTSLELRGLDGIRLAADAAGDPGDPTVILLHGGGQTRHAWGGAAGVLAAHGWHAVAVDLRGHGNSEWSPDGVYDLDRFAADTAEIARRYDRPALVGASLGGLSSLAAIGEADDPIASALVLVDVTPRLEMAGVRRIGEFMRSGLDGFDSLDDVADAIAGYVTHRPRPTDLSGLRKNVRQRADGKWVWHWDPRFVDRMSDVAGEPTGGFIRANRLHEAATRVQVPTLLVRGGSSDVVSTEGVDELRRLVPHAEVVDVAGAGHMVAGDRNDRFNAAIVEFLERVVRQSSR